MLYANIINVSFHGSLYLCPLCEEYFYNEFKKIKADKISALTFYGNILFGGPAIPYFLFVCNTIAIYL